MFRAFGGYGGFDFELDAVIGVARVLRVGIYRGGAVLIGRVIWARRSGG